MQGRSWMAVLTLVVGITITTLALARDDEKPPAAPPTKPTAPTLTASPEAKPKAAISAAKTHTVKLDLKIAGLNAKGCDVEIKAAHAGCKFRTRNEHVTSNGLLLVELDDVEILNADRDCTFAIKISEPGQGDRTWRRGLRINAATNLAQTLPCYLSSPSKLARAGDSPEKTKR